ncbi:MAG: type III pantothenate kinase [Gemmatimonadaceae bacterium]|nr:type III pantothenate kinase [Chitinophagaceae bacterium]
MLEPVTLCIDLGNTRYKYAIFEGATQKLTGILSDDQPATMQAVLNEWKPAKSILSSVVEHDPTLEETLARATKFHKLSHLTILPFTSPVGKPETIGADRLALCAAAVNLAPGKNNLVIALGTCITYNFINKYHEFIGGGISPGMDMRFKSLETFTAKLPVIKEDWNFPLIGYDTRTNILSGVILGMAKEIDGFIDAYLERYGNFNVLLTGGNSAYFVPHLKNQIFADPDLLFKGLYAISECNNQV